MEHVYNVSVYCSLVRFFPNKRGIEMNIERDTMIDTKVELKARSLSIIVITILFAGILAGIFAGPGLSFDMDVAKCQKQCEVKHPGDDADSISKKLNCQLGCY
jgi:hypothetical protein